ncbi:hypothetical protein RRF57_008204 [Xylaria bambusicola]|uniref:Major facilitator superfamily (MFS) profile domain-containing protein n=1 Tax=Xylaria bambusicola TaxID=326684 RepID=A0AAN7UHE3_9PEZI
MAAEKAAGGDNVATMNDPEQPEMKDDLEKPELERPNEDLQRGVQDMEGLYLLDAFQSSILYDLIPYVASDFGSHSLLIIYVVSNAITAALFIPLAKIVDVFYLIGTSGMTYCIDALTADASKLKNRGLAYAFTSSPYIITAFAGPKASSEFYANIGWRWGFGAFSIIFPIVSAPLYFVLKFCIRKAKVQGTLVEEKPKRTLLQMIWFYIVEFDPLVAGVVLFSTGLVVFLLPFDIASGAPYGWGTAYIIAMIVIGLVIIVIFGFYEALLAPTPMLNFKLLSNRTATGACLIDATYQISYYCWNNYFTSFLQAVNNLGIAEASYVNNTFNVVSGLLLLLVGYLIRRTSRFKWLLYIGVPLYIFALGLMIYFRRPNQSVGYLVFCEVLISIGGSVFIIVGQLAILAAVDHQHVASALSLLYLVGTVGGSLGATISGSIWTNTFEKALESYLPTSSLENLVDIYGDLETQLGYPVGSATRLAIQKAYGYAQTRMLTAEAGVMGLGLI